MTQQALKDFEHSFAVARKAYARLDIEFAKLSKSLHKKPMRGGRKK